MAIKKEKAAEPKKRGRPRKEIDQRQFEEMCRIHCTLDEIAAIFGCSIDTIENWCKREYGMLFSEVYKRYSSVGNKSLRRWQFEMAEKSVPMAIFLGKNWLGQTDKAERETGDVEDLAPLAEMLNEDGEAADD